MTKYNEIQTDKKLRQHQLRTENEKQNDTEVIHRRVKETKCYLKEKQSEFSETRRRKHLVKKHSEFDSVTLTAPAKTVVRRRSSRPRANRRTDHRGAMPLPILENTVAEMKLAPHEHTQTVKFLQPQFINKVVDDRVTT